MSHISDQRRNVRLSLQSARDGTGTQVSPKRTSRIESLDSLRGVAILAVLVVHSGLHFHSMGQFLYNVAWAGRYGVDLFFAISGFVLYHTYRKLEVRSERPRRIFLIRRWARLAPIYYLGIVIYGLVLPPPDYGNVNDIWDVIQNVTFANGWIPDAANTIVPGGWSISAEAAFGVIFVLFVAWLSTPTRAFWFCIISWAITSPTTGFVSVEIAALVGKPAFGDNLEYFPWAYLPTFLSGIWCWHLWHQRTLSGRVVSLSIRAMCGLAAMAMFLAIPFDIFGSSDRTLIVGSASTLLLYAWSGGPLTGKWLWPLGWLGRLSFGIYLIHFPMVNIAKVFAIGLLPLEIPSSLLFGATLLFTVVLTVPLAWVSWILLEQPVHAWVNNATQTERAITLYNRS